MARQIEDKNPLTRNLNYCSFQANVANSRTKPMSLLLINPNQTLLEQSVLAYQIPLETNTNSTNLEE
jgi:hypothetical protein